MSAASLHRNRVLSAVFQCNFGKLDASRAGGNHVSKPACMADVICSRALIQGVGVTGASKGGGIMSGDRKFRAAARDRGGSRGAPASELSCFRFKRSRAITLHLRQGWTVGGFG